MDANYEIVIAFSFQKMMSDPSTSNQNVWYETGWLK